MSSRARIALGYVLFVLLLVPVMGTTYGKLYDMSQRGRLGWQSQTVNGRLLIAAVSADDMQPWLQVGDELLAVNGSAASQAGETFTRLANARPGAEYQLRVRRAGEVRELLLRTVRAPWFDWAEVIARFWINVLFLVTGLVVFRLKPFEKHAWLLALMLGTVASVEPEPLTDLPRWFAQAVAPGRIFASIFIAVAWHFFLVFPARAPLLRRFPKLERLLYWPYLLVITPWFTLTEFWRYFDFLAPAAQWMYRTRWLITAAEATAVIYMVFTLVTLVSNYRAADPLARRKLHVIAAGSGMGLLNFFLMPGLIFLGIRSRFPTTYFWLNKTLILTLPLVPLSFAYAIVKHQVIPVGVLLRRSARYLLVARGAIALEIVVAIIAATVVLQKLTSGWQSSLKLHIVTAAVVIALWNIVHGLRQRFLAPIIERRFFRQSYDAQQILSELTEQLRSTASLPELLTLVGEKIQTALQTENVVLFLRDAHAGDFQSAYVRVYQPAGLSLQTEAGSYRLSAQGELLTQLAEDRQPLDVELLSAKQDGFEQSAESHTLTEIRAALLLPLISKGEMLGVVSLGQRLGDLPFAGEDKRMLQQVTGAASLAIENAHLLERMLADARRRQELEAENEQRAKELEEARQLQLSMLPKTVPTLPHLEIAAYMKTATEVGGDYYDFHLSEQGELTIVVGDATGHGLKAGTLVTATKSLFNHLAATPDIPDIFQHSSRALKRMNLRSLFMAMTMVKVREHRMVVGSAGMPPILIYRAATAQIEELSIKGIPLGSLTGYTYREVAVTLAANDVVVLLSDGYPERFNPAGEMLGYDQLRDSLCEAAARSPQQIIEQLVLAGDAWAEGRPTDDDVTFVVIKVH
ncbi:MAG: SpoIIE family protein phosphatase [Acidobacteria bacterium]|nr:SpoIIE family protein phosphatase [Acidobacteriota bacterium]